MNICFRGFALVAGAILAVLLQCLPIAAKELLVVTEEYPPYNYANANGTISGLSSDIVRLVLDEARIPYTMALMPWARAYKTAQDEPNVLIYSMYRSENREHLFQWIGKVAPFSASFYGLKGRDFNINSIEQAKSLSVGTIINNFLEQNLQSKGFVFSAWGRVSSPESCLRMLLYKRTDLTILPDLVATFLFTSPEFHDQFKRVFPLDLPPDAGLHLAASLGTDPEDVARLREALARIRKDGRYAAIYARFRETTGQLQGN